MIFDLDLPEHGSYSITNNLMILIGVILAIFLFSKSKWFNYSNEWNQHINFKYIKLPIHHSFLNDSH